MAACPPLPDARASAYSRDMAFTQDDIDALDANYRRGVQSTTTQDGQSVTFRTVDDYLRLRKLMLADVNGTDRRPRSYSVARISKARS